MAIDFKKRLASLQGAHESAKENKGKNDFEITIENGKYRALLSDLELRESSSSGKLMVKREWTVLEGDHADTVFSDFLHIEASDFAVQILHRFIELAGYEVPEKAEHLVDALDAILKDKPEFIIQVKVKDGFVNVTAKELLETSGDSAPEAEADAPVAEAEADEPSAEPVSDGLEDLDRTALKAILKEEGIEFVVYKTTTEEQIIIAIREARGTEVAKPEVVEEEPEAPEVEADAPEEKPVAKTAKKTESKIDLLKNFCDANDITYDKKKADEKSLIATIKKGKYKASDLTAKELKLLKEIGATVK